MDTKEIIATVAAIRDKLHMTGIEDLKEEYSGFYTRYPRLFDMSTADSFDVEKFTFTMAMYAKVQAQTQTQEEADVEYGQKMFDAYVTPHLPK